MYLVIFTSSKIKGLQIFFDNFKPVMYVTKTLYKTPREPPILVLFLQLGHQTNAHTSHSLLILSQRAKLEEATTRTAHKRTALMRQVNKLVQPKAMNQVIHDNRRVGILGLANHPHCARVVEEEVVHETAPPRRHAMRAAEAHVTDEGVAAAVKVLGVVIAAEAVLLVVVMC